MSADVLILGGGFGGWVAANEIRYEKKWLEAGIVLPPSGRSEVR